VIHVYAVLRERAQVPPLAGVDGHRVTGHAVAGLTSAVSVVPKPAEPSEENLLRHAGVIDALAKVNEEVLPARFAAPFADSSALARALGSRADRLRAQLTRVHGCVELGVRILRPRPRPAASGSSGREYLGERLAEASELDALVHRLGRHARDSRRVGNASGQLVGSAYLVEAGNVGAFRSELATVEREHPELAIVCTGPWAPFNFASVQEDG
jgi:gas vesicle protein GvpL/GvpF